MLKNYMKTFKSLLIKSSPLLAMRMISFKKKGQSIFCCCCQRISQTHIGICKCWRSSLELFVSYNFLRHFVFYKYDHCSSIRSEVTHTHSENIRWRNFAINLANLDQTLTQTDDYLNYYFAQTIMTPNRINSNEKWEQNQL